MEGQKQQIRLSRLAKQAEFDYEENAYVPSPVTIHIHEDGCEENNGTNNCSSYSQEDYPKGTNSFDNQLSVEETEKLEKDSGSGRSHGQSKVSGHHLLVKQSSSQGSNEGSSPSLSRDSSSETYTDSTGIDLQQFILDTLYKSQKDRMMLLKIEQDLMTFVRDSKCQLFKFSPMSSYNRMLVHRVAAFFGLEHNVDKSGVSVIVNKTKNTRIPDFRFQDHIKDELIPEEPKKLILKRDSASIEEGKESPDRQSSMDSKRSKSFEEREEEYEKARARIFNQDEGYGESPYNRSQDGTLSSSRRSSQEDLRWMNETRPWSSTDSDSSGRKGESFDVEGASKNVKNVKKVVVDGQQIEGEQLLSTPRPVVNKASSFSGISLLTREPEKAIKFNKAESFNSSSSYSELSPVSCSTGQDKNSASTTPLPAPSPNILAPPPSPVTGISTNGKVPIAQEAAKPEENVLPSNSVISSSQSENREGNHHWNGVEPHLPIIEALPSDPVTACTVPAAISAACEAEQKSSKSPAVELRRQQSFPGAQPMVNNSHPLNSQPVAAYQQPQGNFIYIPFLPSNHMHLQQQHQPNNPQIHRNVFPAERNALLMESDLANHMSSLSFAQHEKPQQSFYLEKDTRFVPNQQRQPQQIPLCIPQLPTNPQCCACPPNMQNKDTRDNSSPAPGHQFVQGYSFISLNPQENFVSVPYMYNNGMGAQLPSQSGPMMTHPAVATATTTSASTTPNPVLSPPFPYVLNSSQRPQLFSGPLCFMGNCASSNGNNPAISYAFLAQPMQNGTTYHHPIPPPPAASPFMPTLHLLRPSIPVIGPTQNVIPPQLATPPPQHHHLPPPHQGPPSHQAPPQQQQPPPHQQQHHHHHQQQQHHHKGGTTTRYLPFGKNESSDQMKASKAGSSGIISGAPMRFPQNPAYHRGIRPMQDVCLLSGAPMGGGGLVFRPPRFPPPPVHFQGIPPCGGPSSRGSPKACKPHLQQYRNRWNGPPIPPRTNSYDDPYNRGLVLEVEGIPEGMKRGDVERYLEAVTQAGARLHFPDESKCDSAVINPANPRGGAAVLAVFDTVHAAQSALRSIKTSKFRLRSTSRHRPNSRS